MQKTDKSVHNICIAAIKRHTVKPYDFRWTMFYEQQVDFTATYPGLKLPLIQDELIICSTVVDSGNWGVLTTRNLFAMKDNITVYGSITGAKEGNDGSFKDYRNGAWTLGSLILADGSEIAFPVETGRASMVMIYGMSTAIGQKNSITGTDNKLQK